MKNAVVGALLMAVCLVSPKGSSFGEETPAVPADSALERAKEVFDRRMARIEEEAEESRHNAREKIRSEYLTVIERAREQNDQAAVNLHQKELQSLLGEREGSGQGPEMTPGKPFSLLTLAPIQKEGTCEVLEKYGKDVPAINGRITQEKFLWAHAPSSSEWPIPAGAKTFKVYATFMFGRLHPGKMDCVMKVLIDGKTVAKTPALHNDNPSVQLIVRIPKGAKTMTLVSEVGLGGHAGDACVWVEPYFHGNTMVR